MKDLMSSKIRTHLMFYSSPPGRDSAFKLNLSTLDYNDPLNYLKMPNLVLNINSHKETLYDFELIYVFTNVLFCLLKMNRLFMR